ncbi:MAG: S49 family peptidase, partial [Phycisphaerae bacterium]
MTIAHQARCGLQLLIVALACLTGCMPDGLLITPVSTNRALTETVINREDAWASDKIVIIDIAGLLLNAETPGLFKPGEHPVALLTEQLDKARRDKNVKAVVLRINSPGGGVTASEIMHDEITRFKKRTHKPVIAILMDVAASGGYYVACACDQIYAQHSTVTGSIGVIVQLFEFSGTMAKLGVVGNAIVSGPNKAAGSPFGPLSEDQRAIFQGIVDRLFDQFVAVVVAGRPSLDEP